VGAEYFKIGGFTISFYLIQEIPGSALMASLFGGRMSPLDPPNEYPISA